MTDQISFLPMLEPRDTSFEDELYRMNSHAERYEEHLRYANECSIKYDGKPLYTEEEIREKVHAESEYYKALKKNKLEATGLYGKK